MRFLASGPPIPSHLIAAHERGEVLFLCGAGIAMPAGLPSFLRLAALVANDLGVPHSDPHRSNIEAALSGALVPALRIDEAFDEWQRAYNPQDLEAKVAARLAIDQAQTLEMHRTLLGLSKDATGSVRLVTTNFDRLFQEAAPGIESIVAPHLPTLDDSRHLKGIVHLHGMVPPAPHLGKPMGLVLSEADFGRAYLSEGWASRFIRDVVSKYVLVLVGYSADDTPVRYLLKGLRQVDGAVRREIYAFAQAVDHNTAGRWRALGVKPVLYAQQDLHHRGLWDSLSAWASKAADPIVWRQNIVSMAMAGPRALEAFQRGQVASLLETVEGAQAFATASSPPPADWLCVLDQYMRYEKPVSLRLADEIVFDPLQAFGLDDDPPRPHETRSWPNQSTPPGRSIIDPRPEELFAKITRLGGPWASRPELLPRRLELIGHWIARNWSHPVVIWWAAKRGGLHPDLVHDVQREISRSADPAPIARLAWRLLDDAFSRPPQPTRHEWFELSDRIKKEGWTLSTMRAFEEVVRPRIVVSAPDWPRFAPAIQDPATLRLSDMMKAEIQWFSADGDLAVDGALECAFVRAYCEGLRYGVLLLNEIGKDYVHAPSIDAEQVAGERSLNDGGAYFLRVVRAFEKLLQSSPDAARRIMASWPDDDVVYFNKLRIWALRHEALGTGEEVARHLNSLPQNFFWDEHVRRELLWTLRARWADLPPLERDALAARIQRGRDRWQTEDDKDYFEGRSAASASMLSWLQLHGCELNREAIAALPELKSQSGGWRDSWGETADHSFDGRSGTVHHMTEPDILIDLPPSEIIPRAQQVGGRDSFTFTRNDPFYGLVRVAPLKALAALSSEGRKGRHPTPYWQTLLQEWPDSATPRATRIVAERLMRLPAETLVALRSQTPRWLKANWESLPRAFVLWDVIFAGLSSPAETTSAVISESIGGIEIEDVEYTLNAAINAPVGELVEVLLNRLDKLQLKRNTSLPAEVAQRLLACLVAPGDGALHTAALLGQHLLWLHTIDPAWAREHIVDRMHLSHPQARACWNGFFYETRLPDPALFAILKPHLIQATTGAHLWPAESHIKRLGQFLALAACVSTPERYFIAFEEVRAALQNTTPEVRDAALDTVSHHGEKESGWREMVKPFLDRGWPREGAYQTPATTHAMLRIVAAAGNDIPEAAATVRPFLVPTVDVDTWIWRIRGKESGSRSMAKEFPVETLMLIDAVVARGADRTPYDLGFVLDLIVEARPALRLDSRWQRLDRQTRRAT